MRIANGCRNSDTTDRKILHLIWENGRVWYTRLHPQGRVARRAYGEVRLDRKDDHFWGTFLSPQKQVFYSWTGGFWGPNMFRSKKWSFFGRFLIWKSRFTIPEPADFGVPTWSDPKSDHFWDLFDPKKQVYYSWSGGFWVPEVIDGTSLQTVLRVYFVIFWQMSVYGWERWDAGQTQDNISRTKVFGVTTQ